MTHTDHTFSQAYWTFSCKENCQTSYEKKHSFSKHLYLEYLYVTGVLNNLHDAELVNIIFDIFFIL